VKSDPDLAPVPRPLKPLLSRCLHKDPKKRLRDIGDAWELLAEETEPPAIAAKRSLLWPAIAGLMALLAAAVLFLHFREKPATPPEAMRFQIRLPQNVKFEASGTLALSPDSHHVAFPALDSQGNPHIFVQDIDGGEARELVNTKIGGTVPPVWWSPDSAWIGYSGVETIDKVEAATGLVQPICEKPGPAVGGAWNRDGVIIFGSVNTGLWRVPATGGKPVPLTRLDASRHESTHQLPVFLPDGRHYLFLAASTDKSQIATFARLLDDAPEKPSRLIVNSEYSTGFVALPGEKSGWLLYLRNGSMVGQTFDMDRLSLTGKPVNLPAAVATAYQTALFSVSPDLLVFRGGGARRMVRFEWIDTKSGNPLGTIGEPSVIDEVRLSPDEKHVAYSREDDRGLSDIWILDLERGSTSRLTFGDTTYGFPVWSPDGSEVVYGGLENGAWQIFRKRVDGAGAGELVLKEQGLSLHPSSWSPDGRFLLFVRSNAATFTRESVAVLPLQKGATPLSLSGASEFNEAWGRFSPDGHYVVYASPETGRYEVYVRAFAGDSGGQPAGKWMVLSQGGRGPDWTRDGKKLVWFYNGAVWGASVDLSHGFHAEVPQLLYRIPLAQSAASLLMSDGRALVINPAAQLADEPMNVIVNWMSALKPPEGQK